MMIHHPHEKIIVRFGDIELSANAETLMLNYLKTLGSKAAQYVGDTVPRIGDRWVGQGGIYAGMMRARNDASDYPLIVGPEIPKNVWDDSKAAAAKIEVDGHRDFTLPFRPEQSLQFANVLELFEKEWYWSCEQHAAGSDYAWYQTFSYGGQHDDHKSCELRARVVRRFNHSVI